MRAVVISRPGEPGVLAVSDVPSPVPPPGWVRIRVRAFGVNRADLLQRRGGYPAPPGWPERIPGLEYAGEIDVAGEGVTDWAPGDRVMGITGGGTYAEYVTVPHGHLLPIPDERTFTEAAAIPEVFVTAYDALERIGVTRDEWVLVHAIGSGVGTAALQLIHARGGTCIGSSRTAEKLDRARALGLAHGIDSTAGDVAGAVRALVPDGAHAAVDLVGGDLFPRTLEALRVRGRLVLVGLTAGRKVELDLRVMLSRRLRIEGTVLRSRSDEEKTALTAAFRRDVLPLFTRGAVRPIIDRVFPFDEIVAAHRHMEANANFGKIVVEVP